MIASTFTDFGLQGMDPNSSSWIVEADTFNHITGDSTGLHGIRKYSDTQNIQIADSNTFPIIAAISDLGSSFSNVFVYPGLSTNLISVNNWLIIIVMFISPMIVILCKIKCRGL